MVVSMKTERVDILNEARTLLKKIKKISSLDLPEKGRTPNKAVPWRLNGHAPVHLLHQIVSRVGGFPPQLPRYFIRRFSKVGDIVCDPFCGKGTSLLEAVAEGRKALGCDIGPEAVIISRAKTNWPRLEDICLYVEKLPTSGITENVPKDVKLFYHPKTLEQILAIREKVLEDMLHGRGLRRQLGEFTMGVLLGLLHGKSRLSLSLPSNHTFAMSPNYVRKYVREHGLVCPVRDVKNSLLERILMMLPGPRIKEEARVFEDLAQRMDFNKKGEWSGNVDLIITSPPYLSRQTYIRDSWLRLWLLGRDPKMVRRRSLETGNILKFVEAMEKCLSECLRLLKLEGRCFLVCGTAGSSLRGKKIKIRIGELVAYAATRAKHRKYMWHIENYIEDKVILKRGSYFAVRSNGDIDNGRRRVSEDDIISLVKVIK